MRNFPIHALSMVMLGNVAFALELSLGRDGAPGMVALPSAYMHDEGFTSFTYFDDDIESGEYIGFQAADDLFLNAQFINGDYGRDVALNLKYRLFEESNYLPEISVGINDLFGIGPNSAEYLVASKRYGYVSASIGAIWGAHSGFVGEGRPEIDAGAFSTDHMFSGDAELFGGVTVSTPFYGLSLSAEYLPRPSGDYAYGLQFRPNSRFALSAYSFGDDSFGFALTLGGNPYQPVTPQDSFPPPVAVVPRALLGSDMSTDWYQPIIGRAMGSALAKAMEGDGFKLLAAETTATTMALEIADQRTLLTPQIIGRIMRGLSSSMPASIEKITITMVNAKGIPTTSATINRAEYEAILEHDRRTEKSWQIVELHGATKLEGENVWQTKNDKRFSFGAGLDTQLDLFGESEEIALNPYLTGAINISRGLSLNARATIYLNAFDQSEETSLLPATEAETRVRTDSPLYEDEWIGIDRLTLDYFYKIGGDVYGRLSAGLLEKQYGGLNAEMIYAPPTSPLAVGLDVAYVIKRSPDELFGFGDYETLTGDATLYWDTGYKGIEASLSYGRFLGEDWGTTLGISRKFPNGWEVSGELVVPERFFDDERTSELLPSLNVRIPLQWSLPIPSQAAADIGIQGGRSDFGARLNVANPLYPTVRNYDSADYKLRWGSFWQ